METDQTLCTTVFYNNLNITEFEIEFILKRHFEFKSPFNDKIRV